MAEQQIEVVQETPEGRAARLAHLEGVVKRGREAFLEVGRALDEVR